LQLENAILDGEIVCLDKEGVSRFSQLFWGHKGEPILYVFDLLWLNGEDLRQLPLVSRKERLRGLIDSSKSARVMYAQHVEGRGKQFFEEICTRDLEGIVGKRRFGIYKDNGNSWIKIKNRSYSQAEGRHEMLKRER
jgi:bifunctional non-homologous end joining protein LigD